MGEVNNIPAWKYTNGWSDQEVRQEVQTLFGDVDVTINLVTGIRGRCWGILYKEPKKTDAERIAELEATVASLIAGDTVRLEGMNTAIAERENKQPELPFVDSVKETAQTISTAVEDILSSGLKEIPNANK